MSQRVVTGAPVNLKERIAALQQRAASTSPQSSSSFSASPSSFSLASSSSTTTNGSGFALRERIAKFEEKGAVPVPRGSFGLGAPPTREGGSIRKRGELYGNRITSVDRSAPSSPPSALSRLGVNRDLTGDGRRSASTSEGDLGDGSPVRKRCISTSILEDFKTSSTRSFAFPSSATSDSIDEPGCEGEETASPVRRLFVSDTPQSPDRLVRRNSVSGANALSSSSCNIHLLQTSEDLPTSLEGSLTPTLQDTFEVPGEHSSRLDVDVESHAKVTPAISEQNFKGPDVILNPALIIEDMADRADRADQHQQVPLDAEDEDLVKTPVVSTFAISSIAMPRVLDESTVLDTQEVEIDINEDNTDLSNIPTPSSGLSSPFMASFEVGERAYHETQKYVVVSPSRSAENSITGRPDEHDGQISAAIESNEPRNAEISCIDEPLVQPDEDNNQDTISEGKEKSESSGVINKPLNGSRHIASSSFSESNGSSSRRRPPSPITIIQDKQYVEPSLELKTGPKSFHAVVHRKKEQAHTATSTVPLPRTIHPSTLSTQFITVRHNSGGGLDSGSPGSPDLSALVAQALYLEQHLMDGQGGAPSPPSHVTNPDSDPKTNDMSQTSQINFPRGINVHEELGNAIDLVPPTPPPKAPHVNTPAHNRESSRTTWSWSSGQESSEDSASVLTPPSPTFDLTTPSLYEGSEHVHDHMYETRALSVEPLDEDESRRSISSILSSPGRSARKKVLSMSRSTANFGRMLARTGRSSSTIGLPDDSASTYTCDSMPTSVSASVSVSEAPTRPSSPGRPLSQLIPLVHPSPAGDARAEDLRPISVLSMSTASANSPLDRDLFDAFPAVPSDVPKQDQDLSLELGFVGQDDGSQSPPPPTPPSKSPILRTHPSSLSPPTPPSPNSKLYSASLRSKSVKSRSKVPILALPSDFADSTIHSSAPRSHTSTGTSVFSAFSRSLSGRSKARTSSNSGSTNASKQQTSVLDASNWFDDVNARYAA